MERRTDPQFGEPYTFAAVLSSLDTSLYDTIIWLLKCPRFQDFSAARFKGVQLGQVAIYCRVSTDDQSCERQERDLRAFAKRAGHKIVAVFKETASGAKNDACRAQEGHGAGAGPRDRLHPGNRAQPMGPQQRRTWRRRSTIFTAGRSASLRRPGLSFDLSTASGKLMRTIMAGLAEFERDLIRERVKSGLASARARGVVLGRQLGQRPSDKKAKKVLALHKDGLSYRLIGRNVGLSKKMDIVKRAGSFAA